VLKTTTMVGERLVALAPEASGLAVAAWLSMEREERDLGPRGRE
jgi:hypothetical protein